MEAKNSKRLLIFNQSSFTLTVNKKYNTTNLGNEIVIDTTANPVSGFSKKIYKIKEKPDKIFSLINAPHETLEDLIKEFDFQDKFSSNCNDSSKHYGVPKIFELGTVDTQGTKPNFYAIMEKGGDLDLFDFYIGEQPRIELKQLILLFKNILYSVNCVHSLEKAHLDLKPENIMIDSTTINHKDGIKVRLIDFGFVLDDGMDYESGNP